MLSLEDGARVLGVVLVFDVVLPVGSHQLHGLLLMEAVEHVLTHQRVVSISVHLMSELQLLLLVNLTFHVIVLDLTQ